MRTLPLFHLAAVALPLPFLIGIDFYLLYTPINACTIHESFNLLLLAASGIFPLGITLSQLLFGETTTPAHVFTVSNLLVLLCLFPYSYGFCKVLRCRFLSKKRGRMSS